MPQPDDQLPDPILVRLRHVENAEELHDVEERIGVDLPQREGLEGLKGS